jgi:hypothetical protein
LSIGWLFVAHGSFDRAYYGTDARALEFLVGAIVAAALCGGELSRRAARVAAVLGPCALLAAIAANVHLGLVGDLFRGQLLAYAALTALIVVGACVPGPLRAALSLAPLRALGRISYGVYVYHWPLFLLLDHQRTGLGPLALTAARLAATFAFSTLSYVALERPIRTRQRLRGRVAWIAVPACLLAASMAGVAVAATAPQPQIHFEPLAQSAMPPIVPTAPPPTSRTARAGTPTTGARITEAPTAGTPPVVHRVLLVGDSVALTLGRGMQRWGTQHDISVLNYGRLGCGLLNGAEVRGYWGVERRRADPCGLHAQWTSVLRTFRPDVVVVLFGAWDVYDASWDGGRTWFQPGDATWNAHYEQAVTQASATLRSGGARVLWLEPPCYAAATPGSSASSPWYEPSRPAAIGAIEHAVAARDGDGFSDVVHRTGCPVDLQQRPDGVHYSDPGADAVAPLVGTAILAAR